MRGLSDEDVIIDMSGIADARHIPALLETAKRNGKLSGDFSFRLPDYLSLNTPERLRQALAPFRADGSLPDYPLGSDFTPVEQRLVKALGKLKAAMASGTWTGGLRTISTALLSGGASDPEAMARMGLDSPKGLGEWLHARLLGWALRSTRG